MELEELEALDQLVGLVAMVERHLGDLELLVLDDQLLEVVVDLGRHPFHHPYYPMNPRKQNEKQTLTIQDQSFQARESNLLDRSWFSWTSWTGW